MALIQIGIIISFILNFLPEIIKSNRDHDILSQTFSFTLVKTQKLTRNYIRICSDS